MITRSPIKPIKPPLTSGIPPRRAPTPLRSTANASATASILTSSTATGSTTTPHEAMVASQQAHINDLVQKNRSLENAIKKLDAELTSSAANIVALNTERVSWEGDRKRWMGERQQWMDERKVWAEGCDTMQACHRVQQYRMACALQDGRVAVLRVQEEARKEQLKRLQRDYKITTFQAREEELEAQIEEVEDLRDRAEETTAQHDKVTQELKARCAVLGDEVKSKTAEIQSAHKQRERVEDDLRRLREAHADATATSTASSSKLARLTTQRETLAAQVTSLQRSLELAQDETSQLRTQLTNWQILKKGEDAGADEVRKRKVELELEVREARRHIGDLEARVGEFDLLEAKLQKQRDRVGRLKEVLEEWKAEARDQTIARETADTELATARTQITTLEQKIADLQAQLVVASQPKLPSKRPPPPSKPALSNEEIETELSEPSGSALPTKYKSSKPRSYSKPSSAKPADAPAKPRPKPHLVERPDRILEAQDSDIELLEAPPAAPSPEPSAKARGKRKAIDAGEDGDIVVVDVRKARNKDKVEKVKQGKEKKEKAGTKTKASQPKKKTSASPPDDVDQERSKTKAKTNPKKGPSPEPVPRPKNSKAKSSRANEDSEDAAEVDAEAAPKKKKRKINLFGGSQPATFNWDSLGQTGEGLGIPTQLSPMKETDVVPRRLGRASKG
ncbi:hypothetical protein PAXRUDRAFT_831241 [Paxillus rubicundulus Ve08.2h10]|uniref:Uncharacterized protein n=1 Tax=Paxillus rubicundulus Ve08.2h10 TaxID=930991 RepID=A0A0D0DXD9_9AGAM|nr:hypothetical protein PAXRUDRAFT_831241 [Paxillus rubicundulus Ve08.2h10]